jgi:hypothetical protein
LLLSAFVFLLWLWCSYYSQVLCYWTCMFAYFSIIVFSNLWAHYYILIYGHYLELIKFCVY